MPLALECTFAIENLVLTIVSQSVKSRAVPSLSLYKKALSRLDIASTVAFYSSTSIAFP